MEYQAAARFEECLVALDRAIQSGDHEVSGLRHKELCTFVRTLSIDLRGALERGDGPNVRWTLERRRQLKQRWDSLQLHRGSWARWRRVAGEKPRHAASKEALAEAARDLAYARPPDTHRCALWLFCASMGELRGQANIMPESLTATVDYNKSQCEQMRLDACRTPNLTETQQEMVVKVLDAYCNGKPSFGEQNVVTHYVQGMHILAACPILAGLSEAEALKIFAFVLDVLCAGYYADEDFGTFQRDAKVLEALIVQRMPRLAAALQSEGMPMQLLAFDPLLCLFSHHAPGLVCLRIWDVLLLERDAAIFAVFLSLLELLLPELVASGCGFDDEEDFSIMECLRERTAAITMDVVEEALKRTRVLLDGEGSEHGGAGLGSNFRQQLRTLREAAEGGSTAWIDTADRKSVV